MGRMFGYCRISAAKQNIERQERNIKVAFPDAVIIKEVYTGTRFQGRKELEKLLEKVQPRDTIIFDSVSRMSRDSEEGFQLYEECFHRDVSLVFLKEPHINTETYKKAMEEQIRMAFGQAEKEVIRKHNKSIGCSLTDAETIKQAGISRKSFCKYERETMEDTI